MEAQVVLTKLAQGLIKKLNARFREDDSLEIEDLEEKDFIDTLIEEISEDSDLQDIILDFGDDCFSEGREDTMERVYRALDQI